jgi:transposase
MRPPLGPDTLNPDSGLGKDVLVPRPSKYPEEFRRDAVALVLSSPGRPLREIGRELGVNHETLRGWVNAAKRADENAARGRDDNQLSPGERDELRRLRKKVAELELEKDILRKGAAYFAKEMGR